MIEPKFKKLFKKKKNNKITEETPEDIKKLNEEYLTLKQKADKEFIKL